MDIVKPEQFFTEEQIGIIQRTYCYGATEDEFWLFMETCARLRLSPIAGQIHFVKRWNQAKRCEEGKAQPSIDGFRLVAERTGQYRGQTKPEWCDWDGNWRDVWLYSDPPAAARIGVWREGNHEPLYRVARYDSYVQRKRNGEPTQTWTTMPDVMLLKCAEAQALRAAFPHVLGGVYTPDEMAQADNHVDTRQPAPEVRLLPPAQPSNVVHLPVQTAADQEALTTTAIQMFGAKLRARMTPEELADWCIEVGKVGYSDPVKKVLWGLMRAHAKKLGYSPVAVADLVEKRLAERAMQQTETVEAEQVGAE